VAAPAGLIALAAVTISGAPAESKPKLDERQPEIIEQLFECQSITEASERLACYDAKVAAVQTAATNRDLVVADKEQVKEARRGLFGFTLPKIKLFGNDDDKDVEEIKELTTTIKTVRRGGNGKLLLTLEDGAQWAQTDSISLVRDPRPGSAITIRQAALGSYLASIDSQRGIRVKRVD